MESVEKTPVTPLQSQVGGDHYKDMPIQPVEFIHRNGIGFIEGCIIKYLCRWRTKGGIEDLKKARHFIDLLIAFEQTTYKSQGAMGERSSQVLAKGP